MLPRIATRLPWMVGTLVVALALMISGCGGGGGGGNSPSVSVGGTGTGNGGGAVGTAVCTDCHGNTLNANGYVSGQPVDYDPSKTDLNQPSGTYFETFAGAAISGNWSAGVHGRPLIPASPVQCETCHGNGSQHFGFGPIPRYAPGIGVCTTCHTAGTVIPFVKQFDATAFNQTDHANPNSTPDAYFLQGGVGTSQGNIFGTPATNTQGLPVSKNEMIESCSACHSPSQKMSHIEKGDVFNPPQASCYGCHDPHRPADAEINFVASRNVVGSQDENSAANNQPLDGPQALNFKPQQVNMTTRAKDLNNGTWIRPRTSFPYHQGGDLSKTYVGYSRQGNVIAGCSITTGSTTVTIPAGASAVISAGMKAQGTGIPSTATVTAVTATTVTLSAAATATNAAVSLGFGDPSNPDSLRLSAELLCASCHTVGSLKNTGSPTHNNDIFTQFSSTGHANKAATWTRFSLLNNTVSSRPFYPIDMGGRQGQDGSTISGSATAFDVRPLRKEAWDSVAVPKGTDNTTCRQCHHGIGTIDFQRGVVFGNAIGDSREAHVLWGDSTLTCISCHEPHKNGTGVAATSKNVRVPKYITYNTEYRTANLAGLAGAGGNLRGGVAGVFHDLTPLPSGIGNSVICIFCHQGRDSSWTIWNKVRRSRLKSGDTETVAERFLYDSPNTAIGLNPDASGNFTLSQEHYLLGASLLYGRNLFEYPGKMYSKGLPKHLESNCTGCHMAPKNLADEGGHTWRPINTTCNASGCHDGSTPAQVNVNADFHNVPARANYSGYATDGTVYQEIGHPEIIPANLSTATIYADTTKGGTGLLGTLNRALYANGIRYTGSGGSPFQTPTGGTITWTPRLLVATVNYYGCYNGDGSAFTHNPYYIAQIAIDTLESLGYTTNSTGQPFNRPAGAYTGGTALPGDFLYNRVPTPAMTQ